METYAIANSKYKLHEFSYAGPPKGERSDTPAAHVASVRGEGVTDYMTTDGNARL